MKKLLTRCASLTLIAALLITAPVFAEETFDEGTETQVEAYEGEPVETGDNDEAGANNDEAQATEDSEEIITADDIEVVSNGDVEEDIPEVTMDLTEEEPEEATMEATNEIEAYIDGAADEANMEAMLAMMEALEEGDILIDNLTFPDEVFRNYVIDKLNNGSKVLKEATRKAITKLEVSTDDTQGRILDYTGIELFENITELTLSDNILPAGVTPKLDISKNSKITKLSIMFPNWANDAEDKMALTGLGACVDLCSLTLEHCSVVPDFALFRSLESLTLRQTGGTTITLTSNAKLKNVNIYNNTTSSLDVSGLAQLTNVYFRTEAGSPTINITNCPKIAPYAKDAYKSATPEGGFLYQHVDEATGINCTLSVYPQNMSLIGAPAPDPAPAPAPDPTPVITATKKVTKVTLVAVPGSIARIDLAGAVGKKFKSSNKKVATVDQNGVITIKKQGKTKITFKVGKKKRTINLTVKDPTIPKNVWLTASNKTVTKGETMVLTPTYPEGTNPGGFKWKSSNKKVATVNKNGTVKFKKAGKVTITVKAKRGGKTAKVRFKVKNKKKSGTGTIQPAN